LTLDKRSDQGALLENFVARRFIDPSTVHFWRSKSKAEVDFILEKEGGLIPIEVKTNLTKSTLSPSFMSFIHKYQPKKAFIYSLNFSGKRKIDNTVIHFLPIFLS
jgi:hypothetical protein